MLKKKNQKIQAEEYKEETKNLEETNDQEEQEQIENINYTYDGEYEDSDEKKEKTPLEKEKKIKRIINITFIIIILIMAMIATDVICVTRYHVGPFFAIRTNVYKDGGTKVYYGFGYKVIKYHQVQGRRDTQIGLWTMPYSIEPTTISALDLAIEFRNYPEKTVQKYYHKFLRITGESEKVDKKKNTLMIKYTDPDDAYTLNIVCEMATKKEKLSKIEEKKEVTIIGTTQEFKVKTKTNPNTIYMSNCFAEQNTEK